MSVPDSIYFILDLVKLMMRTVNSNKKKVLIHCHAGYGRTGILIVCYLIFQKRIKATKAIELLRSVRKECVQKSSQEKYCQKFEEFLSSSWVLFGMGKMPINHYLRNQINLQFVESEEYFLTPTLLKKTLNCIYKLSENPAVTLENMYFADPWTEKEEKQVLELKHKLNEGSLDVLESVKSITVLTELLYDWMEDEVDFVISEHKLNRITQIEFVRNAIEAFSVDNKEIKGKTIELVEMICNDFNKVELSTIKSIAHFCLMIRARSCENKMQNMLQRMSVSLLGYDSNTAYENEDSEEELRIRTSAEHLSKIIIVLMAFEESKVQIRINRGFSTKKNTFIDQMTRNIEEQGEKTEVKKKKLNELYEYLDKVKKNKDFEIMTTEEVREIENKIKEEFGQISISKERQDKLKSVKLDLLDDDDDDSEEFDEKKKLTKNSINIRANKMRSTKKLKFDIDYLQKLKDTKNERIFTDLQVSVE